MKFRVQMKDPDGAYESISSAVEESMWDVQDEDERGALKEVRRGKLTKAASKWLRYGEYLSVEIDTEAGTCTVLPAQP